MRNYRSNTNQLANLKNNPKVKSAIRNYQADKLISKNKPKWSDAGIEYVIPVAGAIGLGAHFLKGISVKGIQQAYKYAGSLLKNTRGANTVGGSIKQSRAIQAFLGEHGRIKGVNQSSYIRQARNMTPNQKTSIRIGKQMSKEMQAVDGSLFKSGYPAFGNRKSSRTLVKAVEEGPAKFFSKGFYSKTGVAPFKKFDKKHGLIPRNQVNPSPNPIKKPK